MNYFGCFFVNRYEYIEYTCRHMKPYSQIGTEEKIIQNYLLR